MLQSTTTLLSCLLALALLVQWLTGAAVGWWLTGAAALAILHTATFAALRYRRRQGGPVVRGAGGRAGASGAVSRRPRRR